MLTVFGGVTPGNRGAFRRLTAIACAASIPGVVALPAGRRTPLRASRWCFRRLGLQSPSPSRPDSRVQADREAAPLTRGSRSSATTARIRTRICRPSSQRKGSAAQVSIRPYVPDAELADLTDARGRSRSCRNTKALAFRRWKRSLRRAAGAPRHRRRARSLRRCGTVCARTEISPASPRALERLLFDEDVRRASARGRHRRCSRAIRGTRAAAETLAALEAAARDLTLAILIVSHNTRSDLENCLARCTSIRRTSSHEIVVVDNASTRRQRRAVERSGPPCGSLPLERTSAFARANNAGIRRDRERLCAAARTATPSCPQAPSIASSVSSTSCPARHRRTEDRRRRGHARSFRSAA